MGRNNMCRWGLEKGFLETKSFACAYILVRLELMLSQGGAEELINFTRAKSYRNILFTFIYWPKMHVIKMKVKDFLHKSNAVKSSAARGAGRASSQLPKPEAPQGHHEQKNTL